MARLHLWAHPLPYKSIIASRSVYLGYSTASRLDIQILVATMKSDYLSNFKFNIDAWDGAVDFPKACSASETLRVHIRGRSIGIADKQSEIITEFIENYEDLWSSVLAAILGKNSGTDLETLISKLKPVVSLSTPGIISREQGVECVDFLLSYYTARSDNLPSCFMVSIDNWQVREVICG